MKKTLLLLLVIGFSTLVVSSASASNHCQFCYYSTGYGYVCAQTPTSGFCQCVGNPIYYCFIGSPCNRFDLCPNSVQINPSALVEKDTWIKESLPTPLSSEMETVLTATKLALSNWKTVCAKDGTLRIWGHVLDGQLKDEKWTEVAAVRSKLGVWSFDIRPTYKGSRVANHYPVTHLVMTADSWTQFHGKKVVSAGAIAAPTPRQLAMR